MRIAQVVLLIGFVAAAAFTALQQVRYGMITGRSESNDPQDDPRAQACRRRSAVSAVTAALCLAAAILIGALTK